MEDAAGKRSACLHDYNMVAFQYSMHEQRRFATESRLRREYNGSHSEQTMEEQTGEADGVCRGPRLGPLMLGESFLFEKFGITENPNLQPSNDISPLNLVDIYFKPIQVKSTSLEEDEKEENQVEEVEPKEEEKNDPDAAGSESEEEKDTKANWDALPFADA